MKYIRTEHQGIIIFGDHIKHSDMAEFFGRDNVISAGFVNLRQEACYGRSVSLGVDSLEEDTMMLRHQSLVEF